MLITEDILRRLWPHGDSKVACLINGIISNAAAVFSKYNITSNLVIAHAMAQFSHECGAGTEMVENFNYRADALRSQWPSHFTPGQAQSMAHNPQAIANQAYNGRMGNRLGSDDGWDFRGRGLSQCTGREGYQRLANKTGLDLINHPELAIDPMHAFECGVADFVLCGCISPALEDDVVNVTRHLNGGTIGLVEREHWLAKWKSALGLT